MADKIFETRITDKTKNLTQDEFIIKDPADTQRQMKITLPDDIPSTGVPQSKKFIVRENIADFVNMTDPSVPVANFTASWGSGYRIDATAGNVVVTIAAAATANADNFIQLHRVDNSVNTVTIISSTGQSFFQILGQTNAEGFTLKTGQSVNIRSLGTSPVVTNYAGILSISRLWLPTDAAIGSPVVWHDILDTTNLTLSGTAIVTINNKGSLGAGFNITQSALPARPTLVGISGESGTYASFDGADQLVTSAAQNFYATTQVSFSGLFRVGAEVAETPFGQDLDGNNRHQFHFPWSNNNSYIDLGNAGTARINGDLGTVDATGVNHLIAAIRNGGQMDAYVDGRTTASLTRSNASGSPAGTASFRWSGDSGGNLLPNGSRIYETVCYANALSNSDRDNLVAYLAWRHGQKAILNAQSPYLNAPPLITLKTY